jgi:HlyD family secretion protein
MVGTSDIQKSIRGHVIAGLLTVVVLVGGLGGWAAMAEVAGAVIAPGVLVVESNVKTVQHPTGGVVGELLVRDGDQVRAGDVLIRLDPTQTRAKLEIISKSLDELAARQGRLEAEQDGAAAPRFPAELLARRDDPAVARLIEGEEQLFRLRRASRLGQQAQLKERVGQLTEEIRGLEAQTGSKVEEIATIRKERESLEALFRKKLVTATRVNELDRAASRLEGERGGLVAASAQARGKITETELQIAQIDEDLRAEVGRELAEIRAKTAELVERRTAAEEELDRVDIRSPQDGAVFNLAAHTVGGVIRAGEPILTIVPEADALTVEARVAPQEIDRVRLGQAAVLRFSSFNQRTTPETSGTVSFISADVTEDERTGLFFYTLRVAVSDQEVAKLGAVRLVPGMPVEAFIRTDERTVLSYLVKPFSDQMARAFREG